MSASGGLTWGADGRLYGTTTAGGDEQLGTVFSYDPVTGVAADSGIVWRGHWLLPAQ